MTIIRERIAQHTKNVRFHYLGDSTNIFSAASNTCHHALIMFMRGTMLLSEVTNATDEVRIGENLVKLRALTLDDVTNILIVHGAEFRAVLGRFTSLYNGGRGAIPDVQESALSFELMGAFQGLLGPIIATAANEPDAVEAARCLPVGVQVDAMAKIGALTFATITPAEAIATVLTFANRAVDALTRDPH